MVLIGRIPRGKFASSNQKQYPDLSSDASSVWNFCARSPDVILRGKMLNTYRTDHKRLSQRLSLQQELQRSDGSYFLKSERSSCFKSEMTLEHFHSSGKILVVIERLKIQQTEEAIRSAHSRRSCQGLSLLIRIIVIKLRLYLRCTGQLLRMRESYTGQSFCSHMRTVIFGAISVTGRSSASPASKVKRHTSNRFCATLCLSGNRSDLSGSE